LPPATPAGTSGRATGSNGRHRHPASKALNSAIRPAASAISPPLGRLSALPGLLPAKISTSFATPSPSASSRATASSRDGSELRFPAPFHSNPSAFSRAPNELCGISSSDSGPALADGSWQVAQASAAFGKNRS
jgi:hypothetical protein